MTYRKHDGVLIALALALLSGLTVGVAALSASLIPPLESGLPSHRAGAASRPEGAGIPRIGPERAAALALNHLSETAEGVRLRHPRYRAQFTEAGVRVEPRRGPLRWQWRLEGVTGAGTPLEGVPVGAVRPHSWRGRDGTRVRYPRGALLEQYVVGQASLEQQSSWPSRSRSEARSWWSGAESRVKAGLSGPSAAGAGVPTGARSPWARCGSSTPRGRGCPLPGR